jgi:hypothetical protein
MRDPTELDYIILIAFIRQLILDQYFDMTAFGYYMQGRIYIVRPCYMLLTYHW